MPFNFLVIYGSVRSARQGIKAAKFIVNKLKERKHHVDFVDPKVYKFPLLDKMYKQFPKGKAPKTMEKVAKMIKKSDAIIIVTAEYNHGPPAALKNLMDHYLDIYYFRPSAIVTYSAGSFGGVRSASHWRDMLAEMGMPAIPSSFPIPRIRDAFNDNGIPNDPAYNDRIKDFLDELEWYTEAFKNQRKKGMPY